MMAGFGLFRSVIPVRCLATNTPVGLCMNNLLFRVQACGYAKKVVAKGKGHVKEAPRGPEVCTDPERLTSYAVGVNIFKTGDDPQLRPRHEYPEWLFQLHLGPPKKLGDLEPDSREYFKRLRKEHMKRFNRLHKGKKL